MKMSPNRFLASSIAGLALPLTGGCLSFDFYPHNEESVRPADERKIIEPGDYGGLDFGQNFNKPTGFSTTAPDTMPASPASTSVAR